MEDTELLEPHMLLLRDYFAAKAMQAIEFRFIDMKCQRSCKSVAAHAYMMADAMLEAGSDKKKEIQ